MKDKETTYMSAEDMAKYVAAISKMTKESGEVIGNFIRGIYDRFNSMNDDLVSCYDLMLVLRDVNVNLYDQNAKRRDISAIIEDLKVKWSDLTNLQATTVATHLAGYHYRTRFMCLMKAIVIED